MIAILIKEMWNYIQIIKIKIEIFKYITLQIMTKKV